MAELSFTGLSPLQWVPVMLQIAHRLAPVSMPGWSPLASGVGQLLWVAGPVSPVSPDTMSMSSLRPGQQVAAAHLCCARAGRQDLRLHTMSTEVFLPNRAAGNVPMGRPGIELSRSTYRKQGHFKSGYTVSLTLGHHDALYGLGQREN